MFVFLLRLTSDLTDGNNIDSSNSEFCKVSPHFASCGKFLNTGSSKAYGKSLTKITMTGSAQTTVNPAVCMFLPTFTSSIIANYGQPHIKDPLSARSTIL